MKKALLILFLLLCVSAVSVSAQTIERAEISGRIVVVTSEDLEGVTVYNTSSNKGTVTDENGEFKIEAGLLDILEISAVQFDPITVKIDLDVVESKQLTVFLAEHVNRLREVIISPYDLTGYLSDDLSTIKTFTADEDAINFGIGDISKYQFPDDSHTAADATILNQGEFYNGTDFVAIANTFIKPLFKKKENEAQKIVENTEAGLGLRGIYSHSIIIEDFNIPGPEVDAFLDYANANLDPNLLKDGQEMELIQYLYESSQSFLKQ